MCVHLSIKKEKKYGTYEYTTHLAKKKMFRYNVIHLHVLVSYEI
jgi:hypothetical protein